MSTDDFEYDEELYTDTAMFDADEIVRSVEEVARNTGVKKKKKKKKTISARRRFEMMMEDRRLAEELGDDYGGGDWPNDEEE